MFRAGHRRGGRGSGCDPMCSLFQILKALDTSIGWAMAGWASKSGPSGCTMKQRWTIRRGRIESVFTSLTRKAGREWGATSRSPVQAGEWIHVVGIADGQNALIYKNGAFKKSESYSGIITPQHASAPSELGTSRAFSSAQSDRRERF